MRRLLYKYIMLHPAKISRVKFAKKIIGPRTPEIFCPKFSDKKSNL